MKMGVECIPCLVRQAYEASCLVTDDDKLREKILRQVLFRLAKVSFEDTPPYIGRYIHGAVRLLSGNSDPYLEIKQKSNILASQVISSLREVVESSADPFETSVRMAIAGNIIDCGPGNDISEEKMQSAVSQCLKMAVPQKAFKELKDALDRASNILYLGDNAGEVFFDKLLLEQLRSHPIKYVVKGAPILNDALSDDARSAGLDSFVRVIDNGSDLSGTVLEECSEEFKEAFRNADLIIAKGQGNYETLMDEQKNIFFLLKVKCPLIARNIGCEEGDAVILNNNGKF